MRSVAAYLLLIGLAIVIGLVTAGLGALPDVLSPFTLVVQCSLMGALGGVTYCLRGVYLSGSVRKDWSEEWIPWYLIRPWVSLICGGVSFVFLKAGLLVLEAGQEGGSAQYGFLAFAFIAGLNVDGLLKRLEGIAEASWGIPQSRAARAKVGDGSSA